MKNIQGNVYESFQSLQVVIAERTSPGCYFGLVVAVVLCFDIKEPKWKQIRVSQA